MDISFFTALTVGFLGGVHCLGMCGGIVGAINLSPHSAPVLLLNLGYNLGRIISYLFAGLLAGGLGLLLSQASGVLQGLHIAAAIVLILLGLYLTGTLNLLQFTEQAGSVLWRIIRPFAQKFYPFHTFPKAVIAGSLWGFIPCGMVYSMLAYAATAAEPLLGAKIMLGFGLGTLPNLMAMGLFAQKLRPLLQHRAVKWLAGGIIIALGIRQLLHHIL